MSKPHFISEPMRIGKHEWRITVVDYEGLVFPPRPGPHRCTVYEWRNLDDVADGYRFDWRPQSEWPTYNGDHCEGGMPKTLTKLWEQNRAAVQAALRGDPIPDQQQPDLF